MEAGETSGALKTALYALKQKHLVLIPQNAFSIPSLTWPARFDKMGAIRVEKPSGITDILSRHKVYQREMPLGDESYDLFGDGERTVADPPDVQR